MRRYTAAFALACGVFVGCDQPGAGTVPAARSTAEGRPSPAPTDKARDAQVRTPRADVEVKHDAEGRLKVDVRAKDRTPAAER